MGSNEKVVLQTEDVRRALVRVAHEIVERNPRPPAPALIGIHRRGAFLARRLRTQLEALLDAEVPLGDLDSGFYRDDLQRRPDAPASKFNSSALLFRIRRTLFRCRQGKRHVTRRQIAWRRLDAPATACRQRDYQILAAIDLIHRRHTG